MFRVGRMCSRKIGPSFRDGNTATHRSGQLLPFRCLPTSAVRRLLHKGGHQCLPLKRSPPPHAEDEGASSGDRDHMRSDVAKVDDPQLKAMFETSAEVLLGLVKALGDYERKNEAAWR